MDSSRKLLGLWQPEASCYGGLVEITIDEENLSATEWRAIKDADLKDPLKRLDLFNIQLPQDWDKEVVGMCLGGYSGPHKCIVTLKDERNFSMTCCQPESHRHPQGDKQEMLEWVNEVQDLKNIDRDADENSQEMQSIYSKQLLKDMLSTLQKYENSYKFSRIDMPGFVPKVLVQPGLFKGTYGPHGLEIILLDYEDNGIIAKATKISGDPNVPAGQMTFHSDTRVRMVLDESQQSTIGDLTSLEPGEESQHDPSQQTPQPFIIPEDCSVDWRNMETPTECIARFHGLGQIAEDGFIDPSENGGHWIIFSEDLFGFLWLELFSLSMYHRIKEI